MKYFSENIFLLYNDKQMYIKINLIHVIFRIKNTNFAAAVS